MVNGRCRSGSRGLQRDGSCSWLPWCFRANKPRDVLSRRGVNRRGLSERRYFFANILFGRLYRQNVSEHLLLPARQLLNVTPKESEIVHYSLELLI